jgi:uncharacterized protein GlcG (DUF336 family)
MTEMSEAPTSPQADSSQYTSVLKVLNLRGANAIVAGALAKAREMQIRPIVVTVLDGNGQIIAAQREDGASGFRLEIAFGKAWGAVSMGQSSRELAGRALENPNFFGALASASGGKLIPQPGGVLVTDGVSTILGAAGISGGTSDEDEACGIYGIRAAGLVPVPESSVLAVRVGSIDSVSPGGGRTAE